MSNPLGELISKGEGNYNSYNKGTVNGKIISGNEPINFSEVTIREIMDRQALPSGDSQRIFAVGKFQIIPKTMQGIVSDLNVDRSEKFTPEIQEKLFANHLIKIKHPQMNVKASWK